MTTSAFIDAKSRSKGERKLSMKAAREVSSAGLSLTVDIQESERKLASVAVVITCYNHGCYLASAIESTLSQSLVPDEVIVVDDGSSDNTSQVAKTYPNVRYIHQRNQGLSAARNTGIKHAESNFILFLDADDLLAEKAVESGVKCFAANPDAGLVFGDFLWSDEFGVPVKEYSPRHIPQERIIHDLLKRNFIGMHAAVMYRKSTFSKIGMFDTRLRASEDYDMLLRAALKFPIYHFPALSAYYRRHGTNMSRNRALMLQYTTEVLRRAERSPALLPEHRASLNEGFEHVRHKYANPLMQELLDGLRTRKVNRLWMNKLKVLINSSPDTVMTELKGFVGHNFGKRIYWLGRTKDKQVHHIRQLAALTTRSRQIVSLNFGFDRGLPVDRYYIEQFIESQQHVIKGNVLEIKEPMYSTKFGGSRVTHTDVLHVWRDWPGANIHHNLTDTEAFGENAYDCVILTQTLQLIYDIRAVFRTMHHTIKPGGSLLLTMPGMSKVFRSSFEEQELGLDSDSWRLTCWSMQKLAREFFPDADIHVTSFGNPISASAFLFGTAIEDIGMDCVQWNDPNYELIVGLRVTKPAAATQA